MTPGSSGNNHTLEPGVRRRSAARDGRRRAGVKRPGSELPVLLVGPGGFDFRGACQAVTLMNIYQGSTRYRQKVWGSNCCLEQVRSKQTGKP